MADIDHNDLKRDVTHQGTWGNKAVEHRTINSQPNIGDVLKFMKVPAGTKVMDLRIVNAALGAGVTVSAGYTPVDGGSAVPAALVATGLSLASATSSRMVKAPVLIPVESYITLTVAGANAAQAADVDIILDYVYQGEA